jgi:hypothetical protein
MSSAQRRDAGQRTDIDDAAAAGAQHAAARFLTAAKSAQDQVSPRLFHRLERDFLGAAENPVPGHVAEEIDPAKLAIQPRKHRADLLRFGNVAGHGNGPPAQFDKFGRRRRHAGAVAIGEQEIHAGFRQRSGHGAA